MHPMSFSTTKKVVVEKGVTAELSAICAEFSAKKVLIVTDKGIVGAGLLEKPAANLGAHNMPYLIFDDVDADPSATTVKLASEFALSEGVDLLIGFGGGSPMDVAKVLSVLAHPDCEFSLEQCYGVDQICGKRLPLILVPTTAGTGSEVTPISIITTGETTKAGIVSPLLQSDVAILDATLTIGLPGHITAATGIDAMVHAIEAFTSKIKKNPISDMLAVKALQLLSNNIRTAVHNGSDLEARENMLLGACLAGQAFANAPVAAVHALAYPLGGHYHIPHGLSNSLVLPHVMRFNLEKCAALYAELAGHIMGDERPSGGDSYVAEQLIIWLTDLIAELGLPAQMQMCNVTEDSLPKLAKDAMLQQRLLINNPREMNETQALDIYRKAF